MNESHPSFDDSATLDPPGSIIVIGAGPLGIEAALYGRFLGYDVTIVEAVGVAYSMRSLLDQTLPIMPHDCLSPLAISALHAQESADHPGFISQTLPITYRDWIERALKGLIECDLLDGRLRKPLRVSRVSLAPVELDDEDTDVEDSGEQVPPDFEVESTGVDGKVERLRCESVIVATGNECGIVFDFELGADYFFRIGEKSSGDLAEDLRTGRQQIVAIFAGLGGRSDLDLYRPRRIG